jgi:hypothetical protein
MSKASITVRGPNILQPPLLVTEDAKLIEFRDGFGELNALLIRVFTDEMWMLVTKNDPDWEATLVREGLLKPGRPIEDIIKHGL